MNVRGMIVALFSAVCLAASAQNQGAAASAGAKFGAQWRVLAGEWTSEASAGGGAGNCAFRFELGDHILVRTNHAELVATGNRPGGVHDDLMVIHPGTTGSEAHATYWDNEGHVIQYAASWSADGNTLSFVSEPGSGPQFRLTYKQLDADRLAVSFEMAPPGQPKAFKPYTSGRIRRQR